MKLPAFQTFTTKVLKDQFENKNQIKLKKANFKPVLVKPQNR